MTAWCAYDRLMRTRDFYILDKEFTTHNVEFITLHDPTDRRTASRRFLETMLVAAKTYEREQTGEKVRTKMRMRAEKGLWNVALCLLASSAIQNRKCWCRMRRKHSSCSRCFRCM